MPWPRLRGHAGSFLVLSMLSALGAMLSPRSGVSMLVELALPSGSGVPLALPVPWFSVLRETMGSDTLMGRVSLKSFSGRLE